MRPGRGDVDGFDIVHGQSLRFFPELVEALGGDAALLLRQVGIDPAYCAEGRAEATYRQLIQLIECAAVELDCPDFGMRFAKLQDGVPLLGPLGSVMRNSRTFGEALEYVGSHSYAHSLAVSFRLLRIPDEAMVFVGHNILLDGVPCKAQTMEKALLDGALTTISITGGKVRPRKVHFRHQRVSPLISYWRYFGCETCFGQDEDGMFYSDRDLACAISGRDPGAYQAAISFIDTQFTRHRPPLHAEVRGLIMRLLHTGSCTNERIAAALHLHPRTLHRRLAEEGTSFRRVLDEVRRDGMVYYVQQTDLSFVEISERLGFTEQAVMTKSCNRWFSICPSRLRAQAGLSFPSPGSPAFMRRSGAGKSDARVNLSEIDKNAQDQCVEFPLAG